MFVVAFTIRCQFGVRRPSNGVGSRWWGELELLELLDYRLALSVLALHKALHQHCAFDVRLELTKLRLWVCVLGVGVWFTRENQLNFAPAAVAALREWRQLVAFSVDALVEELNFISSTEVYSFTLLDLSILAGSLITINCYWWLIILTQITFSWRKSLLAQVVFIIWLGIDST